MESAGPYADAENRHVATRVVDAIDNGSDPTAALDLLAEDVRIVQPGQSVDERGRAAAVDCWTHWHAGLPDYREDVEQVVCDGDTVVVFTTCRGTHVGELDGIPSTGHAVEVPRVHRFRVNDGHVVEWWTLTDRTAVAEQLGVQPTSLGGLARVGLSAIKRAVKR
jgi:predicted ester cyclase